MSVQVKRRRDTATNVASFVGAQGELIVDTTNNRLRVMDGATAGGWPPGGMSPATVVEGMDSSNVKHGGNIQFACQEQLLTLSGASTASTISFPNQCLIFGVSCRVETAITGTGVTGFQVGRTGGTANEFGAINSLAAGTENSGILGNPNGNYANTTVTVTAVGGNFSGGQLRIQLCYLRLNPPTS
jgi:Major tropism determinant N-terminal domain